MRIELPKKIQSVLFFCAGAMIALVAWRQIEQIWVLVLLVAAWAASTRRINGFLLMFGYYLAFAMDAPTAWARVDQSVNNFLGVGLLAAHAAALSLPWICVSKKKCLQVAIILPLTILPPIGAFNWGHPLLAAGQIFPGTGMAGLLATYALMVWLAWAVDTTIRNKECLSQFGDRPIAYVLPTLLAFVSITCILTYRPAEPIAKWVSIDTQFGSAQNGSFPRERRFQMIKSAGQEVVRGQRVVIFPEGVINEWTATSSAFWVGIEGKSLVLVGTNIRTSKTSILDTVVNARTGDAIAFARVPMPIGSWKLQGESVKPNLFSSNVKTIDNIPSSIIFCYEETLIYPLMFDVMSGAKAVISMANTWSTAGTHARDMQRQSIEIQARLYGLPLMRAENI